MSRGTFNNYLFAVEKLLQRGVPRPEAHWVALSTLWGERAAQLSGTDLDPRALHTEDIDGWLGWLVVEWNRL